MVSFRHRFSRSEKVVQIKSFWDLRGRAEDTIAVAWREIGVNRRIQMCKTLRCRWITEPLKKLLIHWTRIIVICQAFRVRFFKFRTFRRNYHVKHDQVTTKVWMNHRMSLTKRSPERFFTFLSAKGFVLLTRSFFILVRFFEASAIFFSIFESINRTRNSFIISSLFLFFVRSFANRDARSSSSLRLDRSRVRSKLRIQQRACLFSVWNY